MKKTNQHQITAVTQCSKRSPSFWKVETRLKMAPRCIFYPLYYLSPSEKMLSQVPSLPSYSFLNELQNTQHNAQPLRLYRIWPQNTLSASFSTIDPTAHHPPTHTIWHSSKKTYNKNLPPSRPPHLLFSLPKGYPWHLHASWSFYHTCLKCYLPLRPVLTTLS